MLLTFPCASPTLFSLRAALLTLLLVSLSAGGLLAQPGTPPAPGGASPEAGGQDAAPAGEAAEPAEVPQKLLDSELDLSGFKKGLKALEEPALRELLDHWKKEAVKLNGRIGETVEERSEAEGAEKERLVELESELRDSSSAAASRFLAVADAIDTLKGDTAATKAERDLISGLPDHLDFTDPTAFLTIAYNWLKSPEGGIKWALAIVRFLLILFVFRLLSKFVGKILDRALRTRSTSVSKLLREFFVNAATKIVFFIGLVMALGEIGVNIAPLLAGIGVVGFVVGFALQGTLANFAAGVMILLYRPFDVGHFVEAAGVTGTVESMNLVSTTLVKPDNQVVIIPNGTIWDGVITNITGRSTRRVDMVFGIGYDDDIAKAEAILQDIINSNPMVLAEPAALIRVSELADSSVNFNVRPWSKTSDYWELLYSVTRTVKERFDEAGISIPYPQTDVHVHGLQMGPSEKDVGGASS